MKWIFIVGIVIVLLVGAFLLFYPHQLNVFSKAMSKTRLASQMLEGNELVTIDSPINKVSLNNSGVYLSSPYEITHKGDIEFEIYNYQNLGDAQIILLTNSDKFSFKSPQIYNPTLANYVQSYSCKEPKINKNVFTCTYINGSIEFTHAFESNKDTTFFWNESYIIDYQPIAINEKALLATDISKSLTGMNKSYTFNVNLTSKKTTKIKVYVDFPRDKKVEEEYWILVKPSSFSMEKVFTDKYYIDPWINSTGADQGLSYLDANLVSHYKMDETAGVIMGEERFGLINGTITSGVTINRAGIVNSGYLFKGEADAPKLNLLTNGTTTNFSISFWMNHTAGGDGASQKFLIGNDGNTFQIPLESAGLPLAVYGGGGVTTWYTKYIPRLGEWDFVVYTSGDTIERFYIFNGSETTINNTDTRTITSTNFQVGSNAGTWNRNYAGNLDEISFFNRTLNMTDVLALYNNGMGVQYNRTSDTGETTPPSVNIYSPTNVTYNRNSILFEINATDSSGMSGCWFTLNAGDFNYTMTNVSSNYTYTNSSLAQGALKMRAYCNDTLNNINNSQTVSFFIDSVYPYVNITYPANNTKYNINVSILNYTFIETNPDSCWYTRTDGETNSSRIAMGANWTEVTSTEGQNNWTVYCNDSANNINSSSVSFTKDTTYPAVIMFTQNKTYNTIFSFVVNMTDLNPDMCMYSLKGGEYNYTMTQNIDLNWVDTNTTMADGSYRINHYCNDTYGNSNDTEYKDFSIDLTYPLINLTYPANGGDYGGSRTMSLNYTIVEASPDTCWYTNDSRVNYTITCGANVTGVNVSNGANTFIVWINDSGGNVNSSSVIFNVDLTPPAFVDLRNFNHILNTPFSQSITATDAAGIDSYRLNDTSTFTINFTSGLITNDTALLTLGTYHLNISVNDTWGNLNSGMFWIKIITAPILPPSLLTCRYEKFGYYNASLPFMFENCKAGGFGFK
jgi:hypothetical protein